MGNAYAPAAAPATPTATWALRFWVRNFLATYAAETHRQGCLYLSTFYQQIAGGRSSAISSRTSAEELFGEVGGTGGRVGVAAAQAVFDAFPAAFAEAFVGDEEEPPDPIEALRDEGWLAASH